MNDKENFYQFLGKAGKFLINNMTTTNIYPRFNQILKFRTFIQTISIFGLFRPFLANSASGPKNLGLV